MLTSWFFHREGGGMFWRLIAVVCGLTFLVNSCQILADDQCKSVDLPGNPRALLFW